MIKSLGVWWEETEVGALQIDQHGDLTFTYADAWLAHSKALPISISLPKQQGPFDRRQTRPFFAGLLPDEGQREAVARALGVSKANDFRLLERLGGDVTEALSLWPQGEPPPKGQGIASSDPLSDDDLIGVLDLLPTRPFLAGNDSGARLSLAGAQQMLPVVLVNGRIALPAPGQPRTHILKPPIPRLGATTENEAIYLRLAAAVGLPTAHVDLPSLQF